MSIVHKSAQYYCRAFISINGRRINYECIIATSVSCVLSQSSDYTIWNKLYKLSYVILSYTIKTVLCYTYMIVN